MMKKDDKTEREFVVTSNDFTEIHHFSETAYLALKQIQILLNMADVDYFIRHQDPGVLQLFFYSLETVNKNASQQVAKISELIERWEMQHQKML